MTIFDSLKYPISERPSVEQLASLPEDIFYEWQRLTGWVPYNQTPDRVSLVLSDYEDGPEGRLSYAKWSNISLLRKMIKEYDDI